MKTSIRRPAAALCCGLSLAMTASAAFAMHVDPMQEPDMPAVPFALDQNDYERVEFITESFTASELFSITQAGTYALTLTDRLLNGELRKLGAFISDPSDSVRLAHQVGDGRMVFDLQPGQFALNMYAKPFADMPAGEFALKLARMPDTPAAVPLPGALWLLGSGMLVLAGMTRGARL